MKSTIIISLFALPLSALAFQRELSADRPDATESPYTVEPGATQLETALWSFTKDGSSETWALAETNIKFGLTPSHDLQFVLRPWIHEKTNEGFGDIDVRLKWNLMGNDEGTFATALLPYITIPTHTAVSSGEWEGGIILPVALQLTDKLDLGFQIVAAREWNDDDSEHDWTLPHSIALGVSLTDHLGAFIEYVGVTGEVPYQASLNTGLTWATFPNIQFDIALGVGLNKEAEDFSIAQGITFRF